MANGNQSEKVENLLNLSLSATEAELEKSPILRDGIIEREAEPIWEVIVKYHGDISGLNSDQIQVEELIAGYGIITLPESFIEPLAAMEEIEFVEKPKSIYPSDYEGNIAKESEGLKEVDLVENAMFGVVAEPEFQYGAEAFEAYQQTTKAAKAMVSEVKEPEVKNKRQ